MPQRLRVFISSPGDVPDERLRADLVIDKLAQEYSRFFSIASYRWEHEPMLASGHFQDAIDPPSAFDIVILILWSRLGTPLPEKTEVREYKGLDGRAPVTGTEWEYEDALVGARAHGTPEILAFRNQSPAPIDPLDPAARARTLAQLDALGAFWTRNFADRGVFLAAFDGYRTLEEFAERLERSLRRLLERRIAPDAQAAPIWLGAPFRGLQAYEFEHAPIFFGRDGLVARAAEQLMIQARGGSAFLLISGASGSGKSSLVKAALVPRLMKPQRIRGLSFARRASFRPGSGGADIIGGLVAALTSPAGDDVGLPELLAPGQDADKLAAFLRHNPDDPGFVFAGALARVTEAGRKAARLLFYEEAKLILVIDQLEELFTIDKIPAEERGLLIRLMAGLVRSGAVWMVATVRSDFWHRVAESAELVALSDGAGRLEATPPSPAELAEMIRKPAQAAGISFQIDAHTNIGLDAVLAQEAEPSALPLLSFTLEALYAQDIVAAGGRMLTYATYARLGGLEGAIATRADEVVASLPAAVQAALPRVLRRLATIAGGANVAVARAVPLESFPPGSETRAIVDVLTRERLLVASSEGGTPTVRLAHEALISHWKLARDQLANDARDLETRALVERQQARWAAASGAARRQLLLRDPDLANAVDLARRWGDEIDDRTRQFILASRRHAQGRQRLTAVAAAVFAIVAVGAGIAAWMALRFEASASRNFDLAVTQADTLVASISAEVRNFDGISKDTVRRILVGIERQFDEIAKVDPNNSRLLLSRARMLGTFVDNYLDLGDIKEAARRADECVQITRAVVAGQPGNLAALRGLATCLEKQGDTMLPQARLAEAMAVIQEGAQLRLQITPDLKTDPAWRSEISRFGFHFGQIYFELKYFSEATQAFQLITDLRRGLLKASPDDGALRRDLAESLAFLSAALRSTGKPAEAYAAARESVEIARALVAQDATSAAWQRTLAYGLGSLAAAQFAQGRLDQAVAALNECLPIARSLAALDQGNAVTQRSVGFVLQNLGYILDELGKPEAAIVPLQESATIWHRLLARSPDHAIWQHDLAGVLYQFGNTQFRLGEDEAALGSLNESVALMRALNERVKNNVYLQTELAGAQSSVSMLLQARGNSSDAIAGLDDTFAWAPDNAALHWARGVVEYYADRLDPAVADLADSVRLEPTDSTRLYERIWLHVARRRAGMGDAPAEKSAKALGSDWPVPIVSMYLGGLKPDEVREIAEGSDASVRAARECEAAFYIGLYQQEMSAREEARHAFEAALNLCASHQLNAWAATRIELQRMGRSSP
jgi:tetratricopeptide (TPR) repeat protein